MPKESREILIYQSKSFQNWPRGYFFMAKGLFFNESLKKLVFNNIYRIYRKKLTYFLAPEYIYYLYQNSPTFTAYFLGTVYRS